MDKLNNLEEKYRALLRDLGVCLDDFSPDQALDILGISFDNTWYTEMTQWDYITAFFAGILGAIITNLGQDNNGKPTFSSDNSYLHNTLKEFHYNHLEIKYKPEGDLLKNIFWSHSGDTIDRVPDIIHINNIGPGMHRLFSGHDLLQFSNNNVLVQMFQQYEVIGLLKGVSHLFYDLCSSMGLPLPGSSNFALTLYDTWCEKSSMIYQRYFTLKMPDLISTGSTLGILTAYRILDNKFWSHRNHSPEFPLYNKINLLAYSINLGACLICQSFNYFSAAAVVKNAFQLQLKSWIKAKQLEARVDAIALRVLSKPADNRSVSERVNAMDDDFKKLLLEKE